MCAGSLVKYGPGLIAHCLAKWLVTNHIPAEFVAIIPSDPHDNNDPSNPTCICNILYYRLLVSIIFLVCLNIDLNHDSKDLHINPTSTHTHIPPPHTPTCAHTPTHTHTHTHTPHTYPHHLPPTIPPPAHRILTTGVSTEPPTEAAPLHTITPGPPYTLCLAGGPLLYAGGHCRASCHSGISQSYINEECFSR